MSLIACSRMHNITAKAKTAWTALFEWLAATSSTPLEIVDYPAPAPLDTLWRRTDMGAVFMCGWPFMMASPRPVPLAAPLPSPARYRGKPVYFTDLIVHRDSNYRTLADTFGGRVAWTIETSHSSFNALRHHLLQHRTPERPKLYSESVGSLVTVASYAVDLWRHNEPEKLADVRVIATTEPAPVPLLVAHPGLPPATAERLRDALFAAADEPALDGVLSDLCLTGFAPVTTEDYRRAGDWDAAARAAGYHYPD